MVGSFSSINISIFVPLTFSYDFNKTDCFVVFRINCPDNEAGSLIWELNCNKNLIGQKRFLFRLISERKKKRVRPVRDCTLLGYELSQAE